MKSEKEHVSESADGNAASTTFVCPTCGAPLYSHKSRMCGKCGAVLPPEIVLTDAQVEARQRERQWAHKLAEAFDMTGRAGKTEARHDTVNPAKVTAVDLEMELRRISCASEFKHRKRHTWLYVTGFIITLFMWWTANLVIGHMLGGSLYDKGFSAWLVLTAWLVYLWFKVWRRAAPICPNCKQNIRACPAEYCHVCGKPLGHKRCTECGVDHSWTGWFQPYSNGIDASITYCPGCGVELDTCIRRGRAGDRW